MAADPDPSQPSKDSADDDTLWEIGPHTPGKHIVLQEYLKAWYPIFGFSQGRALFIDGFAGPGEYRGGGDGSPVIALKTFRDHSARSKFVAEMCFLFIDVEERRLNHLRGAITPLLAGLGPKVKVDLVVGRFDETMTKGLNALEEQRQHMAPAFVMVDPFGVSQTPLSVIEQILRNPKSEVYITFMWEHVNRFHSTAEFPPHLDGLFGTTEWREALRAPRWPQRARDIFLLYKRQLKSAGAKYVVHFELYDRGTLVYAIFFATTNAQACDKMKQAIWKADPAGGRAFVGGDAPRIGSLFDGDTSRLKPQLQDHFGPPDWHSMETILKWAMSDETDYHSGHVKGALAELEDAGLIEIQPGIARRRRQFPDRVNLRILRHRSA